MVKQISRLSTKRKKDVMLELTVYLGKLWYIYIFMAFHVHSSTHLKEMYFNRKLIDFLMFEFSVEEF